MINVSFNLLTYLYVLHFHPFLLPLKYIHCNIYRDDKKELITKEYFFLVCAKIRVDNHDYEPNLTFVR